MAPGGGEDMGPMGGPVETGETMSEGMDETPASTEASTITLPAENFPQGIDLKDGAKVTFCVKSGPDESGNVTGYFEGGEPDESGTSWEEDFRKEMSPQNPTETPM